MRLKHTLIAALFAAIAGPVFGQGIEPNIAAQSCLSALDADDLAKATEMAAQLAEARGVTGVSVRLAGRECLTRVTGEAWIYVKALDRFAPATYLEASQRLQDAKLRASAATGEIKKQTARFEAEIKDLEDRMAERERQLSEHLEERIQESELRLQSIRSLYVAKYALAACGELLERDDVAALTSPVCYKLFLENGLPDS